MCFFSPRQQLVVSWQRGVCTHFLLAWNVNIKVTSSVFAYPSLRSEPPWDLMSHLGYGILDVPEWPHQQCIVGATRNLLGRMGRVFACRADELLVRMSDRCSVSRIRLDSCPFLLPSLFSGPSQDQSRAEAHWSPERRLIHSLEIKLQCGFTNCTYSALFETETPNHTRARYCFQGFFLVGGCCRWENHRRMVTCPPKKYYYWYFWLDYSIFPLPACYIPGKSTWSFLKRVKSPCCQKIKTKPLSLHRQGVSQVVPTDLATLTWGEGREA